MAGKERIERVIGEGTPIILYTPNRLGDYTDRSPFRVGYRDLDSSSGVVRNREGGAGGERQHIHTDRWRGDGVWMRLINKSRVNNRRGREQRQHMEYYYYARVS